MTSPLWLPPLDQLADDLDELGWETEQHGRMRDEADADDAVETTLWTPDDDARFRSFALGLGGSLGSPLSFGGRKLQLPEALRAEGLTVEVVPGWETRGDASFNPGGVVGHHTAGAATGDRPSLRICTYGRSDLPGPLCQVFLSRNGTAVVVASGRANHAGSGGFRGLVGNSAVFGIEAESKGTLPDPWTPAQLRAYPRVVRALLKICNRDESWYCRHRTWAGERKVDTVQLTDDWMRTEVRALSTPAPVLQGGIKDYYEALPQGVRDSLGKLLQGEQVCADGVGRYSPFANGVIVWHPETQAHAIRGAIHTKWNVHGREAGLAGYPLNDEFTWQDCGRSYQRQDFTRGLLLWLGETQRVEFRADLGS